MSLLKTLYSDKFNNNINNNDNNSQPIFDDINNYKFNYEIKLGEGRFGKVRLALHKLTNMNVAIKIIDKNQIKLKEQRQRIDSEISILKKLNHYNIIKLYSIIENEERIYLIQEYIQGNDLNFFIKHREKPATKEQNICIYFREIISAVEYLHNLGISHRDLKPENILINKNNHIKLIDFGLSKIFSKGELLKTSCGSPYYAPPEMVKGNKYNGINSDIWSLGIILYLMLFQELPFMDADINRLYKKISEGKYEIPENKINIVSKDAIDLVKKILEINPKKRIKINGIKNHKWFNKISNVLYEGINIKEIILPIDEEIVEEIRDRYGYDKMRIRNTIIRNLYNNIRSLYFILLEKKINMGRESVSDFHSNLYIDYINDEKNKLKNYDNNIENVLKCRMNSHEELNIINDYEENKEHIKNTKILNIEDDNNNINIVKKSASLIRNIKIQKIELNRNNHHTYKNKKNKNNSCNKRLGNRKTKDFYNEKKNKKRISQKENMKISISSNFIDNGLEENIYSERYRNNLSLHSNKNNNIIRINTSSTSKRQGINTSSISKKQKIKTTSVSKRQIINNSNCNINIIVKRRNEIDKHSNKDIKKNNLSITYDKNINIIKKKTSPILYKNSKKENKEDKDNNGDKDNKNDKGNIENKDNINNGPFIKNRNILDQIISIKKNVNIINNNHNIQNALLLSTINKSSEISKNIINKKIFKENSKKYSKKKLSTLKLDNENQISKKIKIKPKKTVTNQNNLKEKNFEKYKLLKKNRTSKKANENYLNIKGKTIDNDKKKNFNFINYKTNSQLLNKKLRKKLNIGQKNDDNLFLNSKNYLNNNIENNNLYKNNAYSTINNLSNHKEYYKNNIIRNSSTGNIDKYKNKIMVNIIKKENNINLLNSFNPFIFNKIIKSNLFLNENKNNLDNNIFEENNIINYESPFDLNFLFIYNNIKNIKALFEKYLQRKKISFILPNEKSSNNKRIKINYNCCKNNGAKFNVNLVKIKNRNNNENNKLYIWRIKNQTSHKYDFINFINSFNNCICK